MTNNIDRLIDVSECNELIQLADGGTTLATYRGTYMGYISKKKIILCNVLYIPELKEIWWKFENIFIYKYKEIFYN